MATEWLNRSEPQPWDTLEQERREVLKSVLESMRSEWIRSEATGNVPPDPDRTAACSFLMRHLADAPPGRHGRSARTA